MKLRVARYPKKLLLFLGFLCVIIIAIHISGYGLKPSKGLEKNGRNHVNLALPTMRNGLNGHQDLGKFKEMSQNKYKELRKFTRTDHERTYGGPNAHNRVAGIILPDINQEDGVQIQMTPLNKMAANPSNIPSHRYREVPPAFLEEDTCPACYGKSLCDQFYAGHIKLDMETDGLPKIKHVFFGYWEGYHGNHQEPPLSVVVKKLIKDGELVAFEDFLCNRTDSSRSGRMLGCDMGDRIMHTHLSSNAIFQKKHARTELYKVAHNHVTSVGLAMCATQPLLDSLTKLHNIPAYKDTDYRAPEVAMLATSIVLNPEALVIKFCHQHIPELVKYVPKYYGECGRFVVVQPGGMPLQNYLQESWQVRVNLALQILQMVEDFLTASPSWMMFFVDFRFDNLYVSDEGKIQLIDLEDVVIVDREEITQMEKHHPTPVINVTCNEECLWHMGKTVYEDPLHQCGRMPGFASPVMNMLACQRLLSDLDTTKYIRLFEAAHPDPHSGKEQHLGGLLHDIPADLESRMSELLYECVFESKPGSRIYAVDTIKEMLLRIIQNGY